MKKGLAITVSHLKGGGYTYPPLRWKRSNAKDRNPPAKKVVSPIQEFGVDAGGPGLKRKAGSLTASDLIDGYSHKPGDTLGKKQGSRLDYAHRSIQLFLSRRRSYAPSERPSYSWRRAAWIAPYRNKPGCMRHGPPFHRTVPKGVGTRGVTGADPLRDRRNRNLQESTRRQCNIIEHGPPIQPERWEDHATPRKHKATRRPPSLQIDRYRQ